jgi:hypothetical protein
MHQSGLNYSQIAKRLTSIGMKTATEREFTPQTVKNIISRMTLIIYKPTQSGLSFGINLA